MRPSFSWGSAHSARAAQGAERVVLEQKPKAEGCELDNVASHSAGDSPDIEQMRPSFSLASARAAQRAKRVVLELKPASMPFLGTFITAGIPAWSSPRICHSLVL
jgi:hypothetical protein